MRAVLTRKSGRRRQEAEGESSRPFGVILAGAGERRAQGAGTQSKFKTIRRLPASVPSADFCGKLRAPEIRRLRKGDFDL